jgi:hypothetical protein
MRSRRWGYRGNMENLYTYAYNNAITHNDPSGLEVTVRCSPIERLNITLGYHCAVVVECDGITCRFDGGGEQSVGDNPAYPNRPVANEDCTADAATTSEGDIDYRIGSIWKSCENEMACLKNAYRRILQLPYRRLGPNSNTYANALLRVCSLALGPWIMEACTRRESDEILEREPEAPDSAPGWNTPGYGDTVTGGPEPDWK